MVVIQWHGVSVPLLSEKPLDIVDNRWVNLALPAVTSMPDQMRAHPYQEALYVKNEG